MCAYREMAKAEQVSCRLRRDLLFATHSCLCCLPRSLFAQAGAECTHDLSLRSPLAVECFRGRALLAHSDEIGGFWSFQCKTQNTSKPKPFEWKTNLTMHGLDRNMPYVFLSVLCLKCFGVLFLLLCLWYQLWLLLNWSLITLGQTQKSGKKMFKAADLIRDCGTDLFIWGQRPLAAGDTVAGNQVLVL